LTNSSQLNSNNSTSKGRDDWWQDYGLRQFSKQASDDDLQAASQSESTPSLQILEVIDVGQRSENKERIGIYGRAIVATYYHLLICHRAQVNMTQVRKRLKERSRFHVEGSRKRMVRYEEIL
jgi:hypothetical protein